MVRKSGKHTLHLQLCMDVIWVHSVSLQGQVQEQVCCCHTARVEQMVGYSVCSTDGFVEHQRMDLRPGNIRMYLRKRTLSEKNLMSQYCHILYKIVSTVLLNRR